MSRGGQQFSPVPRRPPHVKMKVVQVLSAFTLCFWQHVFAADECQPVTWANANARGQAATMPMATMAATANDTIQPGDINCRNWDRTFDSVNYYTCTKMADKWLISVDFFFVLNPMLLRDCSNIQTRTLYCVTGCEFCYPAEHIKSPKLTCEHLSHRARPSLGPPVRPGAGCHLSRH